MRKRNTGGEEKLNKRTVFYGKKKKQRLGSLLSPFPYARRKNDALSGFPWIIYRASRAENFYPVGERKRSSREKESVCRISSLSLLSFRDLEAGKEREMLVRSEKMSRWRRQKMEEKEKKAETIDAEETREKKKIKHNRKNRGWSCLPFLHFLSCESI